MAPISVVIEQIDELLQADPVKGFRRAASLLDHPFSSRCDHARALDAFGTACRVFGDLHRAEGTYRAAIRRCRCFNCWWDRLRRLAYLRAEQGEPEAARVMAERSLLLAPDRPMVGRCRVALAYARLTARYDVEAVNTARLALGELARSDLLYLGAAVTSIAASASRIDPPPVDLLRQTREDLRALRRRWPRNPRYRSPRGKASILNGWIGYRLGEVAPCELRATLERVQLLHVRLGLWRDAAQIVVETAEICSEMRREDHVARTLEKMLDALPRSLPRHVAVAIRRLRDNLWAINRADLLKAVAQVRAALAPRYSLPVPGVGRW